VSQCPVVELVPTPLQIRNPITTPFFRYPADYDYVGIVDRADDEPRE
jgi:hypothetical protein